MGWMEKDIKRDVLRLLGGRSDTRLWNNPTGLGLTRDGSRTIAFGLPGSADLIGLFRPSGRFLAVECKSARGRQSLQQKRFQAMIESMGGVYLLVRSANEALSQLEPYLHERS